MTFTEANLLSVDIKIIKLDGSLPMPEHKTRGAAGFDLHASMRGMRDEEQSIIRLRPNDITQIPCGIAIEIPAGWVGALCPRSGLSIKGISIVNSPGIIDSDYRGELSVTLINHGFNYHEFKHGDRIAQLVLLRTVQANFIECEELSPTERGTRGHGSTGHR